MKKYFHTKGKKVFLFKLVLLLFIFMAGCSERNNISDATLIGYDASPFEKTMINFFDDIPPNNEIFFSYGWKEGWLGDNTPNPDILISNEKAMTYVVSLDFAFDGETKTHRVFYYMIHNTKDNTLSVQGGSVYEDGDIYPISLNEARNAIESVFDEYN